MTGMISRDRASLSSYSAKKREQELLIFPWQQITVFSTFSLLSAYYMGYCSFTRVKWFYGLSWEVDRTSITNHSQTVISLFHYQWHTLDWQHPAQHKCIPRASVLFSVQFMYTTSKEWDNVRTGILFGSWFYWAVFSAITTSFAPGSFTVLSAKHLQVWTTHLFLASDLGINSLHYYILSLIKIFWFFLV